MAAILVIDDEKTLLKMFSKILKRFGHDVHVANTGKDGLQMFDSGDYDLIITDIVMPGVDGNYIATYIRNSDTSAVPIIGMSGTPWWAEESHFNAVLSKPFSLGTLLEHVDLLTDSPVYENEYEHERV